MPDLRIENLSFTYTGASDPVLRSIHLTIPEGQFVLVTGPSGGGKSTLALALAGLIPSRIAGHIRGGVGFLQVSPSSGSRAGILGSVTVLATNARAHDGVAPGSVQVRGYDLTIPRRRDLHDWPGYIKRVFACIPVITVPLLIGALRNTSVMAMVVDARAFGSHNKRSTLKEHQTTLADGIALGALAAVTLGVILLVALHIGNRLI